MHDKKDSGVLLTEHELYQRNEQLEGTVSELKAYIEKLEHTIKAYVADNRNETLNCLIRENNAYKQMIAEYNEKIDELVSDLLDSENDCSSLESKLKITSAALDEAQKVLGPLQVKKIEKKD